ncbi:MAG: RluA family pseudouridine synthase [Alphaproteobacteria bacterium]
MFDRITVEISTDEHRWRIDKALATLAQDLSRTRIKGLLLDGHISLDGEPVYDPAQKVTAGQEYTIVVPDLTEGPPQPENIPLDVVYEDQDLIVINKPAGMVVHPAPGHSMGTLVNALLHHCGESLSGIGGVKRPGIVHRLDKDTSGLMVVAKHDKSHKGLSEQFADRTLSRTYTAFVWGVPKPLAGTVEGNIGRHPRNRKTMAVLQAGGRPAITHYETEEIYGLTAARVRCKLETGRTHQIRVHMTSIGHSLIADPVYGRQPKGTSFVKLENRQALHAKQLEFIHPMTKEKICLQADLPQDLVNLEETLQR